MRCFKGFLEDKIDRFTVKLETSGKERKVFRIEVGV